jgi:hypothetical protein
MNSSVQLELGLSPARRWGGARPGAGRKRGARGSVPHLRRGAFTRHEPCHVALRVRRGVPSLRDGRIVREVERAFRAARERGAFRLVHYSLQRDSVHLIVEAAGPVSLARGMMSIGARLARAVNRVFGRPGAVLAERFHHRVLRTPRDIRNVLVYVLANFRKHAPASPDGRRAFGPALDPGSSGRWFSGWTRALAPPAGAAPVVEARSWLLRVGWQRHGPIDPGEAPAAARR